MRVFRTIDGGTSWNIAQNGLPSKFKAEGKVLNKVIITSNPFNALEYILIIPEAGIYLSTDGGDNWSQLPSPINRAPLNAVIARGGGDEVVLVGFHAGSIYVYKLRNAPNSIERENGQLPQSFALYQNYPNPFNPSTVISYQLSEVSNVELKVFDLLGREVATLVNETQGSGYFSVKFKIDDLKFGISSGIYFYQLKTDKFIQVKKMILMK